MVKRVLLKLSGELLLGEQPFGIDPNASRLLAKNLKSVRDSGLEVAVVMGGGNLFRGRELKALGIPRTPADHMGMLATLLNGIALQQELAEIGCAAKVMTALECPKVAETYQWGRALDYLADGQLLLFVGGTGNPYFTTDTAAAMRASEIHADMLLKATKVDGVYDQDPLKVTGARKYETISYSQVLAEKLEVMDATSIALCMSNHIPIMVFHMQLLGRTPIHELLTPPYQGTLIQENL
jgi:uridylate kinase